MLCTFVYITITFTMKKKFANRHTRHAYLSSRQTGFGTGSQTERK